MAEQKTHVIDGVTYVEVARKAEVGEYVVSLADAIPSKVTSVGSGVVDIEGYQSLDDEDATVIGIDHEGYYVLEPLADDSTAYDRDEVIETLIRKVDALQADQTALEQRLAEAEEGERQLFRLFSRLDDICENLIDQAEDAEADIVLLDERTGGLRKCR